MNAYLQSVQSLNQQAGGTSLTFFVSKRKLMDDGNKKKVARQANETKLEDFSKLQVELDPIRAETSYQLR